MKEKKNLIIACGERINGNSDYVANFIFNKDTDELVFLRELDFVKCNHCYFCENENKCKTKDDATKLFEKILNFKNVVFVSPVIFFNFPSHAKTFVDRAQFNWTNPEKSKNKDINLFFIGIAGQKFDDSFYGIIKTLKVFAISLGISYKAEELFFGVDKKGEIKTEENALRLQNFVTTYLK